MGTPACRVLLGKKQRRGKGAQEVLAALSFLEEEERVGRPALDAAEFRYVLHRFSELARLDPDEVCAPDCSLPETPSTCQQPLSVTVEDSFPVTGQSRKYSDR